MGGNENSNGKVTAKLAVATWRGRKKFSIKTARRIFKRWKMEWRKLREKPQLTAEDIRYRRDFSGAYVKKRADFWEKVVCLDGKYFPIILKASRRRWAASQTVRGIYRSKNSKSGLEPFRVKKKVKERQAVGGGIFVQAGICGPQRKMFWHVVKGKWGAQAATEMYGKLHTFLRASYPDRRKWIVIEDNDPSGFRSKMAIRKKKECNLVPIELPKRSPDLQPMDYAVWAGINKKMRESEKRMGAKVESKKAHLKRSEKSAKTLGGEYLKSIQRSMKRRLAQCLKANGGLFEE